jgi:gamma-glutamylcyclotransferase (GGCT)/AIG2-like uncharacterized protein YtfP
MNNEHLTYFAYGSNMHPHRMRKRVPSAEAVGTARLEKYSICFHKRSWKDGSGKCNAFYTGNICDEVIGVVYRILCSEKSELDACEGVGKGYKVQNINVFHDNEERAVFTYIADETHIDDRLAPFSWYKQYVVHGARHHGLPQSYIQSLSQVQTIEDPYRSRAESELIILRSLYI